jgi:mono/diheme cytochrome c family protein
MKQRFIALGCFVTLLAVAQDKNGNGAGDATKGKDVFVSNCSACHNADSNEKKLGPGLKDLFKQDKLVNGKKPTEANIKALINAGGNGMPSFAEILKDEEKADVIAYLKTL